MPIVSRLLHLVLGAVFLYAGVLKVANPMGFLDDIRSYQLLPDPYAAWLAMGLPWLEIFAGAAVITGILRSGGLLVLNGALLAFLAAILSAWARGIDIRCGCFGEGQGTPAANYVELILRDLVLLAMGLAAAWCASRGLRSAETHGSSGGE